MELWLGKIFWNHKTLNILCTFHTSCLLRFQLWVILKPTWVTSSIFYFIILLLRYLNNLSWSICFMYISSVPFSSVAQSRLTLQPHGLQHTRSPCPSPTPRVYSNSSPFSWRCCPTNSSSVIPFSSHLQSFPASGSFPMSEFFVGDGQSIGVSASSSVLPVNI